MDKSTAFLKVFSYLAGIAVCITLVPLQSYLHKHHTSCEQLCEFWHALFGVAQFTFGFFLIHWAKND